LLPGSASFALATPAAGERGSPTRSVEDGIPTRAWERAAFELRIALNFGLRVSCFLRISDFVFRISSFVFRAFLVRASFGFRISDFGFPPMITVKLIIDEAAALGFDHVVGIPDNQTAALVSAIRADARFRFLCPCREGEVLSIAAGIHTGNRRPLVLIQNTGLLEAGDALRVVSRNLKVPLVMLLGYRGHASLGSDRPDSAAELLEPTLAAWRIPWFWYFGDGSLRSAHDRAQRESCPVAVVYSGRIPGS